MGGLRKGASAGGRLQRPQGGSPDAPQSSPRVAKRPQIPPVPGQPTRNPTSAPDHPRPPPSPYRAPGLTKWASPHPGRLDIGFMSVGSPIMAATSKTLRLRYPTLPTKSRSCRSAIDKRHLAPGLNAGPISQGVGRRVRNGLLFVLLASLATWLDSTVGRGFTNDYFALPARKPPTI